MAQFAQQEPAAPFLFLELIEQVARLELAAARLGLHVDGVPQHRWTAGAIEHQERRNLLQAVEQPDGGRGGLSIGNKKQDRKPCPVRLRLEDPGEGFARVRSGTLLADDTQKGNQLAEFSGVLRALTFLWVALLFASPLLLLLTGYPRAVLASLFVGMHLGMQVTMRIGLFPLIVVVGFLLFFQTPVWELAERVVDRLNWSRALRGWRSRLESLARTVDAVEASVLRPIRASTTRLGTDGERDRFGGLARGRVLFSTVLPYVFLVLILLSSAGAAGYTEVPEPAENVLDTVEMDQSWRMFAPDPARTTRWFVAAGTLEDGTERDVLQDSAVTFDRPARVETATRSARWRKYLKNVYDVDNEDHRSYLGNYLCGEWNRTHETDVESVTVTHLYERTNPYNGTVEAEGKFTVIEYDCSGPFVQNE